MIAATPAAPATSRAAPASTPAAYKANTHDSPRGAPDDATGSGSATGGETTSSPGEPNPASATGADTLPVVSPAGVLAATAAGRAAAGRGSAPDIAHVTAGHTHNTANAASSARYRACGDRPESPRPISTAAAQTAAPCQQK